MSALRDMANENRGFETIALAINGELGRTSIDQAALVLTFPPQSQVGIRVTRVFTSRPQRLG